MLDSSPRNELGKGILDPAVEQQLLALGVIYARRVFHANGRFSLSIAKSPISAIAAEIAVSAAKNQVNNTLVCDETQEDARQ